MARQLEPSPRSAIVTMLAAAKSAAIGPLDVDMREARPHVTGLCA